MKYGSDPELAEEDGYGFSGMRKRGGPGQDQDRVIPYDSGRRRVSQRPLGMGILTSNGRTAIYDIN